MTEQDLDDLYNTGQIDYEEYRRLTRKLLWGTSDEMQKLLDEDQTNEH